MATAGEEQTGQLLRDGRIGIQITSACCTDSRQDARGRVLVTQERRDLLLEEYDRSGMSGVRFA